MTQREQELCRRLQQCCAYETAEDCDEFVQIVTELRKSRDPEVLGALIRCVNDVEAGGAQYELIEAIERFPLLCYVEAIFQARQHLERVSGQWGDMLLLSMLNGRRSPEEFINVFRKANEMDQQAWIDYLSQVTDRTRSHHGWIEEFKRAKRSIPETGGH